MIARRYVVRGSVQGVGFRYFVHRKATALLISGLVRNLDDGSVEVIAIGTKDQHAQLAGHLHLGPVGSEVRGVEELESPMQQYNSFSIAP